jgi:hypothetical protein
MHRRDLLKAITTIPFINPQGIANVVVGYSGGQFTTTTPDPNLNPYNNRTLTTCTYTSTTTCDPNCQWWCKEREQFERWEWDVTVNKYVRKQG